MTENTLNNQQVRDPAAPHEKRNQMFVKRQFQRSMMLQSALITFIVLNAILISSFLVMDYTTDILLMKERLALLIVGLEIIGFIVLYKVNLRATHRIAGPLFNLERRLQHLQEGDLMVDMKTRYDDEFPELVLQFNTSVKSLRENINKAQYLASQLERGEGNTEQLAAELVATLGRFNTTKAGKT